jgi:hypothetical protein
MGPAAGRRAEGLRQVRPQGGDQRLHIAGRRGGADAGIEVGGRLDRGQDGRVGGEVDQALGPRQQAVEDQHRMAFAADANSSTRGPGPGAKAAAFTAGAPRRPRRRRGRGPCSKSPGVDIGQQGAMVGQAGGGAQPRLAHPPEVGPRQVAMPVGGRIDRGLEAHAVQNVLVIEVLEALVQVREIEHVGRPVLPHRQVVPQAFGIEAGSALSVQKLLSVRWLRQ